jgi:hypothetical protein
VISVDKFIIMGTGKPEIKQLNVYYSLKKKRKSRPGIFFRANTSAKVVSREKVQNKLIPRCLAGTLCTAVFPVAP